MEINNFHSYFNSR